MGEKCRLCGQTTKHVFSAQVLNNIEVNYYRCDECGLLQTQRPFWLEKAYSSAINASDTGLMVRNMDQSRLVSSIILAFFDRTSRFVDYGGGYGVFTRMMRDRGFDYYWLDPYAEDLVARGFEYDGNGKAEAVSSFETFEHFVEPGKDIEKILNISDSIIFSTQLLPEPTPQPHDWWYYGLEHGQHVAFYSQRTMEFIAREHGLHYYQCGPVHLLVPRRLDRLKLRLISMIPAPFIDSWNGRTMASRTVSDMNQIMGRINAGQMI